MKLDRTFAQEFKKVANGDGSLVARFAFLKSARAAAMRLSTPNVMNEFNQILQEYGRVTVGLCIAITIYERKYWLLSHMVRWAEEVLKLWTNRPCYILDLIIGDNLHPTRIEQYADSFIKLTTEEE